MYTENCNFKVELLVHGRPITEYLLGGDTFVEGRMGSEYEIRITNYSSRNAVAVVSVDGLSVMNGKPASRDASGYVLEPFGNVIIPGWRLNNEGVAHFKFGALPESYAEKQGMPENVGAIGVVFFFERKAPEFLPNFDLRTKGIRPPVMYSAAPGSYSASIGTEFGRRTEHRVTNVNFDREPSPAAELVLRYDEASNLESRGIRLIGSHVGRDAVREASPFPADIGCVPPRGWHRRK
ncbi:MAG: hypothetical protein HGA38_05145 [Candidatus Moranbacteria bacterium]|nr:hypothetical protein [Candidatus Moranbacteria bacterium]NTW45866.1 hypothetical protein [Candidatus Moranbacteria bacterium]